MKAKNKTIWRRVKLGDFVKVNPSVQLQRGKVYPFLDMADVQPLSRTTNWPKTKVFNGSGARFENGDTLFARITPCLENGKITQVFNLDGAGFGSTEFYVLQGKDGISDSDFIYYLSRTYRIRKLAEQSMIGASGRQRVERAAFENIEIEIPKDINIQKRIADILSAFDDKIELNNKISRTLEQMAQTIFKEWFVNSEKLKVKSEKLFNLGKIICGKTPSKSRPEYFGGEIPFIKIPDMHNQIFILKTEDSLTKAGANSQKTKFVPKNSICVSCIATVGLVAITTEDSQTNQQINTIIPKSENYLEFLYLALKMIKNDLILIGSGGSTTLNINTNAFSNIEIIIPGEETIDKFHKLTSPIFGKILQIIKENQKLAALRDLLLPKLMNNELIVKGE